MDLLANIMLFILMMVTFTPALVLGVYLFSSVLRRITRRRGVRRDLAYQIPDEACTVCLEDIKSDNYKIRDLLRLDCEHWFHKKCIHRWFEQSRSCPNCRCIFNIFERECCDHIDPDDDNNDDDEGDWSRYVDAMVHFN